MKNYQLTFKSADYAKKYYTMLGGREAWAKIDGVKVTATLFYSPTEHVEYLEAHGITAVSLAK